ncbi:helix-turn-helix domain-containing protein [Christiangramia echinicola]|uniref:helix-turn-helix domain-containing protein n=1 Tax=Christiangramia echinicola TaxID=279359 RepID=UPI0004196028|nr:helix-turn-helix domain-containing protein [Christiangramia echinicola]
MNKIAIQSIAAQDVIIKLSEAFGSKWKEYYGEYSIELPSSEGSGAISGINFPNGVGLFKFKLKLKEECCLDFCSKQIHPFKFMYVIEGSLQHQFRDEELTHKIEDGQSVILGANYKSGNKIFFPSDEEINLIILDVDRKKFVDQLTFPLEEMDEIYHEIFADTNAIRTLYHHTQYSLKMAHLVNELGSFETIGLERTSFHGAKALELLTYMLMLYKDDSKNVEQQSILRQNDLKKIKNVVRLIDKNIEEVGNVSSLAADAGISEAKLQEGFQILFNNTVHGYIQERRLEYAMLLLLKTNKTISEIVYAIGLNSRSHFSKIFKEKYGEPPKAIRLNKKT